MNLPLLSAYLLTVSLLIMTPGPVVILIIRTALTQGTRAALLTLSGTNLASLILIGIALALLFGLVSISSLAINIAGIGGCFYLCYLGLSGLQARKTRKRAREKTLPKHGLASGLMLGLSNPKDILFFLAFFPQFIEIAPHTTTSVVMLTTSWLILDISILYLYVVIAQRMSRQSLSLSLKDGLATCSSCLLVITGLVGLGINVSELTA